MGSVQNKARKVHQGVCESKKIVKKEKNRHSTSLITDSALGLEEQNAEQAILAKCPVTDPVNGDQNELDDKKEAWKSTV